MYISRLILKGLLWGLFALLAITIGIYPSLYFIVDRKFALLSTKDDLLLADLFWNIGFYAHIVPAGIALLVGWTQFISWIRIKHVRVHRTVGKIYLTCVMIGAPAAIYIAFYATGGIPVAAGFLCLGIIWFATSLSAYRYIRNREIDRHRRMMIYSYAACFAAVTLRIWLPLLTIWFPRGFTAYTIVAWLSWIPNVVVAWIITRRIKMKEKTETVLS